MNTRLSAFNAVHPVGESATRPMARLLVRLPLYPQGVGRMRKAAKAATTPLSRLLAGLGPRRRCFALKDSDPLWAQAHVESYAASTPSDAPSGASNCGF